MPENSEGIQENNFERVNFKEFIYITKWTLKFVFSIHPVYAGAWVLFTFFTRIRGLINSFIFAKIIDTIINIAQSPDTSISEVYPLIGILILINVFFNLMDFIDAYTSTSLETLLNSVSVQKVYQKINTLGIQSLEDPEVINRIFRSNRSIHRTLGYFDNVSSLIASLASLIFSTILILKNLPYVIPIMVILSLPKYFIDKKYRTLTFRLHWENTEKSRLANSSAGDLAETSKLQEIFLNNSYSFFDKKYYEFNNWFNQTILGLYKRWFLFSQSFNLLGSLGIYVGFVLIIARYLKKLVSVGNVYFELNLLQNFQSYLFTTLGTYNRLLDTAIRIKDIFLLFESKPLFEDGAIQMEKLTRGPEIEFNNVTFKYPQGSGNILDNFNLTIKSGEKVAIVGANGAGKTTIVRLICRMFKIQTGSLKINGNEIKDLNAGSMFQNMGVLFQDFVTYPQLTVRENIYVGNPSAPIDEDNIIEAAKHASALDFINDFPKKFDQILSQKFKGGIRPSTGQWQKIAIARFFYRNPSLVIFDEPTASIDAESEYKIFNQIYNFFTGKTVIIISHRFSTVRNADRILVIDKGKIVEEGNHHELMKLNGRYAKSFLLQAEGYQTEKIETIKIDG